ncbi:hypothetical protein FPV67DRAFT_988162 [Lyophyllum atratum]|nr:hypothetical protein FPV67DRAFT_988162 [Lyophyllum atratum]
MMSMAAERGILPDHREVLPVEVLHEIFLYLGPHDLASISRVSSTLQHEAETILYFHIDFCSPAADQQRILSWCHTVKNVQQKARYVHSLRFPSAVDKPSTEEDGQRIQSATMGAFNALINLQHLMLLGTKETNDKHIPSIEPSTLMDCKFRLRTLGGDTSVLRGQPMWDLLSRNPDIEYWAPTVSFLESWNSFPPKILPRLRQVVLVHADKARLLSGRPVEFLNLVSVDPVYTKSQALKAIIPLKRLSSTLHTLDLTFGTIEDWTAAEMIGCIAEHAPGLISLTVTTFVRVASVTTVDDQDKLLQALAGFPCLEILVLGATDMLSLYLPANDAPAEHDDSWKRHGLHPVSCGKIATSFIVACPRLHSLTFWGTAKSASGVPLTYLRSKTEHNTAMFAGFHSVDTSGWWMR